MLTNILLIGLFVLLLVFIILSFIIINTKLFPYLNKKNELLEKETINRKYQLFLDVSPTKMSEELDQYIDKIVNRYIVYKFIANKKNFIGAEDTEIMVKDLTKTMLLELSELYLFYINMLYDTPDNEKLIITVNTLIKNATIEAVSSFNKSEQLLNL